MLEEDPSILNRETLGEVNRIFGMGSIIDTPVSLGRESVKELLGLTDGKI